METSTQASPLPSIDFRAFWINTRFKLLIPVVVAALVLVGVMKATQDMMPKSWEASTFIVKHDKNMSSQTDIPYLYLNTDTSTIIETILLRDNLLIVIDNLKLNISPEDLRDKVNITKGANTKVIEVKVTWDTPEMSVKIADMISETFLHNYSKIQNASALKIFTYYDTKLSATKETLFKYQMDERVFLETNNVLDFAAQKENLYKSISQIELKLVEEKVRQSDLSAQLEHISQKLLTTPEKIIISELLRTNAGNLTEKLKSELEILRKRYTEDNPKVQHLVHKLAVLNEENASAMNGKPKFDEVEYGPNPVFEELSLRKLDLESQLQAIDGNLKAFESTNLNTQERLSALTKLEQEHFRLKQNITQTQDLIATINTRLIEINLALESNISDFDILEPAQLPKHPKRSFRKVISIGLAFLSFMSIVAFIVIRELLNNSIKTSNDLKKLTGFDFSAVLPDKDQVDQATFYGQFQLLFASINEQLKDARFPILGIASVRSNEGKSFVGQMLVDQFASQKKRVLHIECNEFVDDRIQASVINDALFNRKGIASVQCHELSDKVSKCYFKTDQDIFLNILQTEDLMHFIQSCEAEYDMIVWELFPINMHLQLYKTITQQSTFDLMLTKSDETPKPIIQKTINLLNTWGHKRMAVVLNHMPKKYIQAQF